MTLSGSNLKLDLEMVMLPQIPRIREGSGNLMGRVFLENPTLFLEMGNLFFGQNGGVFWVKFEGTPQMGIKMGFFSGFKMGEFLAAPESYLLPLLYLRDI